MCKFKAAWVFKKSDIGMEKEFSVCSSDMSFNKKVIGEGLQNT